MQRDIQINGNLLPLPYKVALKIFSYLDVKSLCIVCRVCTSWKYLAEADAIWKEFVYSRWQIHPNHSIKNYKKAFQSKRKVFDSEEVKNSSGTYTYRNGNVFEGEWENNLRHGYGRMLYYNNCTPLDSFVETYEGDWKQGKKSGKGRFIWSNGDRYEGDFVDGRREGKGIMILINGDRYEGEWKDSVLHGFAKRIKANGSIYEGEFANGEKDGVGVEVFDNGAKYEGGWKDGNKHGWGRDIATNGIKWEGEYILGKSLKVF
jgi:hypothetical protein